MIQITKFEVKGLSLDHLDLFWEISPLAGPRGDEPHAIFDYDFYVLRSGDSPMGPYDQIAGPLRDQYWLRDIQVSLLHKWRQYFYKIKIVHRPTGEEETFGPSSSTTPEPDLIAAEIIRQEDLLFREVIGRRCWLFIARTFGPRCSCYDVTMGRKTISAHLPCFGTGFLGGYMSPIETWVQIDPSGKTSSESSLQEMQPKDSSARMISFPPVSPRDILVESENRRWKVISMTSTERLRSVVHQEFKIHEIPKGDIEYALPVNVDLKSLRPSAERNFKNSQNLEADEDYSDIFATFGHPRGTQR